MTNDLHDQTYPTLSHQVDQLVDGLALSEYATLVQSFTYEMPASRTLGEMSSRVRIDLIALEAE